MLKNFGMEECYVVITPMASGCKVSKDDELPDVYQELYTSIIASILYLNASQINIMKCVGVVSMY